MVYAYTGLRPMDGSRMAWLPGRVPCMMAAAVVMGADRDGIGRRRHGISLPTARFLVSCSALYVLFVWIGVGKLKFTLVDHGSRYVAVPI